ncbi:ABC transporter permease [Clostridium sardiniense]|uniref:ABC transporter permease n=1 Tax=Clostridium sardiniense TaxID=29369 RepID=A0ABS7KWH8_CLOSR|nr:ABC transporter permease [Clostridium sardiniense]MBY0755150.1 ABC transporter permease [Clostridium sardiniense]MDQ0461097.1 ABC-2 type transport system permease protein [Clostridium sardiniense]
MKRYLKIYFKFLKQYIKTLMEYKEDFIYGMIGFFLIQGTSIIFINLIFDNIQSLKGWSFYEIIFIYGFSQIPRGIDHIFTDYLWIFSGNSIVRGEFDRYLLRPLNPLFQVIAERFQPEGFGELVVGFILVILSGIKLGVTITPILIIGFIIATIGGTLIYTGIKLAAASIAFWTKTSFRHVQMAYELSGFAKYPVTIYPNVIKNLLTFIIPFAFTGFYPGAYLLGKESFFFGVIMTLIVGVITITVAYFIWLKGISIYESAGN